MIKTYQEKESEVDTSIQMNEGEELGMGRVERSLNCPITRQLMEDPVKCKKCSHTYTKKGKIEAFLTGKYVFACLPTGYYSHSQLGEGLTM